MHATIQLVAYWSVAFLTVGLALVLLNIFLGLLATTKSCAALARRLPLQALLHLLRLRAFGQSYRSFRLPPALWLFQLLSWL